MAEFKLVLSRKDGKSFQKVVKDKEAGALLKKKIGDEVLGKDIGMEGYELVIKGGSDKCGFPMRKGILQTRQKITIKGKGVGFNGKNRNKKKQKGLRKKKTVCGERVNSNIVQINLMILKEGKKILGEGEKEAEGKPAEKKEIKQGAAKEEKANKEKKKEEKPAEKAKPEEKKEEKPKGDKKEG